MNNSKGFSSMVVLIIVVLAVVIVWETGKYTALFNKSAALTPEEKALREKKARLCPFSNPADCDTEEGAGPLGDSNFVDDGPNNFNWVDDHKP